MKIKHRLVAVVSAGMLAASTVGLPIAYAVDASTGNQTGVGATDITVQLINPNGEYGGVGEGSPGEPGYNPDVDPADGLGDNIAFTIPTSINFVAKANGKLIGPSSLATFIENESAFSIHASSMRVEAADGWNIVSDAPRSDKSNAVDFQIGPESDMLDAADYLSKSEVSKPSAWNMSPREASGTSTSDRVQMLTAGDMANVSKDVRNRTKVATLHWYVKPGSAALSD